MFQGDINRLKDGQFFNDNLIEFLLQMASRDRTSTSSNKDTIYSVVLSDNPEVARPFQTIDFILIPEPHNERIKQNHWIFDHRLLSNKHQDRNRRSKPTLHCRF